MDNGDRPATKQDLLQLKQELKQDLVQLEERLRAHVSEIVQESETKLLRAFFGWAEATQAHFNKLDRADHAQDERFSAIERWMLEIQKRLEELSRQRPTT